LNACEILSYKYLSTHGIQYDERTGTTMNGTTLWVPGRMEKLWNERKINICRALHIARLYFPRLRLIKMSKSFFPSSYLSYHRLNDIGCWLPECCLCITSNNARSDSQIAYVVFWHHSSWANGKSICQGHGWCRQHNSDDI